MSATVTPGAIRQAQQSVQMHDVVLLITELQQHVLSASAICMKVYDTESEINAVYVGAEPLLKDTQPPYKDRRLLVQQGVYATVRGVPLLLLQRCVIYAEPAPRVGQTLLFASKLNGVNNGARPATGAGTSTSTNFTGTFPRMPTAAANAGFGPPQPDISRARPVSSESALPRVFRDTRPLSEAAARTQVHFANLTKFLGSDWFTLARVVSKQVPQKRGGKYSSNVVTVGSCVFSDSNGDKIKAAYFGDDAKGVDAKLAVGQTYRIVGASVRDASKYDQDYNKDYALVLDANTFILRLTDEEMKQWAADTSTVKMQAFQQISQLETAREYTRVNVLAMVAEVGELVEFQSKKGEMLRKREVRIADPSGCDIHAVLWGDEAYHVGNVLARGSLVTVFGTVKLYQGDRTLSVEDYTTLEDGKQSFDEAMKECVRLTRGWWNTCDTSKLRHLSQGSAFSFDASKATWTFCHGFQQAKQLRPLPNAGRITFEVRGIVAGFAAGVESMDKGPWTEACPNGQFGHAIQADAADRDPENARCKKCGPVARATVVKRYCVYVKLDDSMDRSVGLAATMFGDVGERLFTDGEGHGYTAEKLSDLFMNEGGAYYALLSKCKGREGVFKISGRKSKAKDENSRFGDMSYEIHDVVWVDAAGAGAVAWDSVPVAPGVYDTGDGSGAGYAGDGGGDASASHGAPGGYAPFSESDASSESFASAYTSSGSAYTSSESAQSLEDMDFGAAAAM